MGPGAWWPARGTLGSGVGTLVYNGQDLNTPATSLIKYSVRPVPDSPANRTVKYVIHTFRFWFMIAVAPNDLGNTTTDDVENLRRKLMVPGADFQYVGRGNDFSVNVTGAGGAGGARDVQWGPRPIEFTLKHKTPRVAEIEYEIEVAIPECQGSTRYQGVMAFWFTWQDEIDAAGFHRVTFGGVLEIALTRRQPGDRIPPDDANAYRNRILFACPPGYRPEPKSFTLSEDRRKLSFTIPFVQMPRPLQPGVIESPAEHILESVPRTGFTRWMGTIRYPVELSQDQPRSRAWERFFEYVLEKLTAVSQGTKPGSSSPAIPIPLTLSIRDVGDFDRAKTTFTLTYTFSCTQDTFLRASGLWQPVASADDTVWRQSLVGTALQPNHQGIGGFTWDRALDAIVDLCQPANPLAPPRGSTPQPPGEPPMDDLAKLFRKPDALNSWLVYHCAITIEVEDNGLPHKPIADTVEPENPPSTSQLDLKDGLLGITVPSGTGGTIQNNIAKNDQGYLVNYPGKKKTCIIENVGTPDIYVILTGYAARVGFPIAPPTLVSVGGANIEPANREGIEYFVQWSDVNLLVPVACARWRLRWLCTEIPDEGIGIPIVSHIGG